jgi:hypothetical protein
MAIVMVNGDVTGTVHPARTWGELLEALDTQRAVCEEVVTAVRLNGVEEPSFRSAAVLAMPLAADAEVFVETVRPEVLIRETLDEAETVAATILEAAQCLGGSFRGKDVAGANHALSEFADSLGSLIVVTSAVAQGAEVSMHDIGDGRVSAVEMINHLIAHTERLVAAQNARDWSTVADVIEYDIAGSVRRWPLVLKAIRHNARLLVKTAA